MGRASSDPALLVLSGSQEGACANSGAAWPRERARKQQSGWPHSRRHDHQ
jgi:hypothetical protein